MNPRRTSTTRPAGAPSVVVSLNESRDMAERVKWLRYVDTARRAQQSLRIEDGREAGKAWRAWLDLAMSADQQAWLNGEASR